MAQAALKIEPQGEWLSESAIAKRVKLDRATVARRLEDLGFEPDEERSNSKLKMFWFDDEMEFAIKSAKDSLTAAKIRDTRATYQLKELKLAEARRELVPAAEVAELSQRLHSLVYKEFAVNLPKKVAPRLARSKTAAEVMKLLKAEADKILKRLKEIEI